MNAVFSKEFGMACALGLPINEHRVRVSSYLIGQHGVVRHCDKIRYVSRYHHIHHQDLALSRGYPHHLIELLGGEGAVVAYVDDNHVSEMSGSAPLPENVESSRGLTAALRIDQDEVGYLLQRADGAEHHRVANGAHPARGSRGGRRRSPLFRISGGAVNGFDGLRDTYAAPTVSLGCVLPPSNRAGNKVYAASSDIVPTITGTSKSKSKPRFFSRSSSSTDTGVAIDPRADVVEACAPGEASFGRACTDRARIIRRPALL
jgi:hypothetical protein